MTRASDTAKWADDMQFASLREMSEGRRCELALQMSAAAWNLSRANIDATYTDASLEQRTELFIDAVHGPELAHAYKKWLSLKSAQVEL